MWAIIEAIRGIAPEQAQGNLVFSLPRSKECLKLGQTSLTSRSYDKHVLRVWREGRYQLVQRTKGGFGHFDTTGLKWRVFDELANEHFSKVSKGCSEDN